MKLALLPLSQNPLQVYCDNTTQLIDILDFILNDIGGNAHVVVTTYSTSEEFLRRLFMLRQKGLVKYAILLADLKAAYKTLKLNALIKNCFDEIYLNQNHSKLILVANGHFFVSVCTSQNQTRGNRLESGVISTDKSMYDSLYKCVANLFPKSVKL